MTLFLVDSIGAFMTAFSLFFVMRHFDEYFKMPEIELTYLSAIALSYSIYSGGCYLFLQRGLMSFMKFIGFANLVYCALTLGLLIKYYTLLTKIDVTYFTTEIAIVCALGYLELSVANSNKQNAQY